MLVVEHDEDAIRTADHVIDMGPGAGVHGGEVVCAGTLDDLLACETSITADYLSGRREIPLPRHPPQGHAARSSPSTAPPPTTCATSPPPSRSAPSPASPACRGSGKSSLTIDTLYAAAARALNGARILAGPHDKITGLEHLDKVIDIDQSPIGRTPRSNPATYTGAFTQIRDWFAGLPESQARGYKPGRFCFNVKGGRCEACQGDGLLKIEMHFLPDVYVTCDVCHGAALQPRDAGGEVQGQQHRRRARHDGRGRGRVLQGGPRHPRQDARCCQEVGLGYIKVGQQATTLSGGEAQRVKLSKELSRRATGKTLYILDEPTTGLHFEDVRKLLEVLHRLVEQGNTVVVIEHNLDVIKTADWVIDLGPGGGVNGGRDRCGRARRRRWRASRSRLTGQYLQPLLERASVKPVVVETKPKRPRRSRKPFLSDDEGESRPTNPISSLRNDGRAGASFGKRNPGLSLP